MNLSRSSTLTSLAIGVAAGAIGGGVMLLMRRFDRQYAPKTVPVSRKEGPTQLDPVTRQPVPTYSVSEGAQSVVVPLVCGALAAGVYGLARGRHADHSSLADGFLLGTCTYTAGAFAIMPALGVAPFPWKQSFPEIGGELLRHVAFGIATAAAYGLIDDAC
jgi:hypothetical protein